MKIPNIISRFSTNTLVKALGQKGFFQSKTPPISERSTMWQQFDIGDFKTAYNSATNKTNPRFNRLYDILDKTTKDTHVKALMENRVLNIMSSQFALYDTDGKEDKQMTELFKSPWFGDFIRLCIEHLFYPASAIEITKWQQGKIHDITLIPRKHLLHTHHIIIKHENDTKGWDYNKTPLDKSIIPLVNLDMGILTDLAPLVILKTFVTNSWANFVQNYGVPPRYAKMRTNNPERQKQLSNMLQGLISQGTAVIQGDEEINILSSPGVDAFNVFDKFITRLNSEMSKRTLGNDAMTDNKDSQGTYGSLQVLADVVEDRYTADKMFVRNIVNHELIPRLVTYFGYPQKIATLKFDWDNFQDLTPKDLVSAISSISSHFDVDPDYIQDKLGIPVTPKETMTTPTNDDPEKKSPITTDAVAYHIPKYPQHCCDTQNTSIKIVADASLENTLQHLYDHRADIAPDNYEHYSETLQKALKKGYGDISHNYEKPDHALKTMYEMNLYRFSVAKSLAIAKKINDHAAKSKSFSDFKLKVASDKSIDEINTRYLKTEYDYTYNASASAARYQEYIGQKEVLPYWQYKTMNDSSVRDSHGRLHNKIFKADDSVFNRIYPPNGWGCRCEVQPVKNAPNGVTSSKDAFALLGGDELETMQKNHMDINRSKAAFIFADAQLYVKNLEGFNRKTAKMSTQDFYGSKDYHWDNIKNDFEDFKTTTQNNQQALQWFENKKNDQGIIVFSDYNNRPIRLSKNTLTLKLSKKGEKRHLIVDHIENILQNPHEVWLEKASADKYDLSYYGFYKDKLIKIPVRVFKTGIHVKSFFEVTKNISSERKGILIKKVARR